MFKFRKAVKSFVERKENGGMIIKPYHCIQTLHNRKWMKATYWDALWTNLRVTSE